MAAVTTHFFEGAEKLLEVWFTSSRGDDSKSDLTKIPRKQWEELLKHVNCQVVSITRRDTTVSYVLSESSMFISEKRFILKTCGSTTLLHAVKPLLKLVKAATSLDTVDDFFYSRKKFERPELQHKVHQNFEDETALLDELFDNGAAYALGRLNRDCWYLYTFDTIGVIAPDQTLELLMQDLDQDRMRIFSTAGSSSAADATKKSGISDLIPGTIIDDKLFEPCGYSMNGLLPNDQYFTIHITPEPEFSYVSFETNVPQASYRDLINHVLKVFKPGRFLMTVFANKASVAHEAHLEMSSLQFLDGYNRVDHQLCQFKNYNLTYTHYSTPTSTTPLVLPAAKRPKFPAAPPH